MRPLAILILALSVGCNKPAKFTGASDDNAKKEKDKDKDKPQPSPATPKDKPPSNPQGNMSGAGGGGVFAPHHAAMRLVNQVQLDQLYKSLSAGFLLDNRLPSKEDIVKESRGNRQLEPLLKDEIIVLTGTATGDIWAYTMYPQQAQEHFVITKSGVVRMPADELKGKLEAQKSEVKLAK